MDCIGGDDQFDSLAVEQGCYILVYPPTNDKHRVFVETSRVYYNRRIFSPMPYQDRNQAIVNCCDVLVGCPRTNNPEDDPRSGTWSTIRKAQKAQKPVVVIGPH